MNLEDLPTNENWSTSDWGAVLAGGDYSSYAGANWAPLGPPAPDITAERIARVHGMRADRGDYAEVNFACVVELTDGTWAACMAWADTTGWGCQDGVEWRVVHDLDSVIAYGLDQRGRERLALTAGGAA